MITLAMILLEVYKVIADLFVIEGVGCVEERNKIRTLNARFAGLLRSWP